MRPDTRLDYTLVCPIKSDGRQVIFPFLRMVAERRRDPVPGEIQTCRRTRCAPRTDVEM